MGNFACLRESSLGGKIRSYSDVIEVFFVSHALSYGSLFEVYLFKMLGQGPFLVF